MKLPVISGDKVTKLLSKIGFEISRQSGSHIIMTKRSASQKLTVVVPRHNELAKGTLLSIISQAELTREEFFKILNKV